MFTSWARTSRFFSQAIAIAWAKDARTPVRISFVRSFVRSAACCQIQRDRRLRLRLSNRSSSTNFLDNNGRSSKETKANVSTRNTPLFGRTPLNARKTRGFRCTSWRLGR